MSSHTQRLIDALSVPSVYPHPVDRVDVIQTHISVVFLAGEFVYKIKKPLNMGFLDYTTLEKRRFFCRQEVDLNSRFSQGIYLDVVMIHQDSSGINLAGSGDVVEVAVLMKKIPEDKVLKNMLLKDLVEDHHMLELARQLKDFHDSATQSEHISLFGAPEVIHQNLSENFEQVQKYVGVSIQKDLLKEISSGSFEFLGKYLPDLRTRVKNGCIRDLHGDLHSEHIVFLEKVMLVDCIEFNDRFRFSDVVSDLAFLLMDIDYLGFPRLSARLHQYYNDSLTDEFISALYRFYKSYRAFVRGKVNSFSLNEAEMSMEQRQKAGISAQNYFKLSAHYLRNEQRPFLMVMCGLMGTGKSFLAEKITRRIDSLVIRSDVVRKQMLGLETSQRKYDDYGGGIYSPSITEDTYNRMFDMASEHLNQGTSVILDASFSSYHHRHAARQIASRTGSNFLLVRLTAPEQVIRERLEKRSLITNEPSDGRWELFHDQKKRFHEIGDSEQADLIVLDSSALHGEELGNLVRRAFLS